VSTANGAPEWEYGRESRRGKDAVCYCKIPVQDFVNGKRIAKMLIRMAGRKPEM